MTIGTGPDQYPTILYQYDRTSSDVIVLAHEFGHALNLVASEGRFVAPIVREVCAFIGEIALVRHFRHVDETSHIDFQQAWQDDSHQYLGVFGGALRNDLIDLSTAYKYYWNYPVSRYIAITISETYSVPRIWLLFQGGLSAKQLLQDCVP